MNYRDMAIRTILSVDFHQTLTALIDTAQGELATALQDVTEGRFVGDAELFLLGYYLLLIDHHNGD